MANAKILEQKQVVIDEIKEKFANAKSIVLFDPRGLKVSEVTELRRSLRESGSDYKVYKNTLAKRAIADSGLELDNYLEGPTAISFSSDELAPVKIISEFAKKHEALELKAGVVEGKVANIEELNSDNSLVLTDYDEQTVSNFLEQVVQRVSEVNDDQMKQLGIEAEDNPILHLIPTFSENYLSGLESIKTSNINEQDVNAFNQKFEVYQSTNLQGVTVKGLLTTIGLNNEQQDEDRQIKEINFNGEEYEASSQNIAFIKEDIKTDSYYRVEFEKDQETGIIYRAVINPK